MEIKTIIGICDSVFHRNIAGLKHLQKNGISYRVGVGEDYKVVVDGVEYDSLSQICFCSVDDSVVMYVGYLDGNVFVKLDVESINDFSIV